MEHFTRASNLCVVIGTIAFGMGIVSPGVRVIINWGVLEDCEMYVQESGRAGRDGLQSFAITFYGKHDLNRKYASPQIINYCVNEGNVCRRTLLFQEFEDCDDFQTNSLCVCCDACELKCKCSNCSTLLHGLHKLLHIE